MLGIGLSDEKPPSKIKSTSSLAVSFALIASISPLRLALDSANKFPNLLHNSIGTLCLGSLKPTHPLFVSKTNVKGPGQNFTT